MGEIRIARIYDADAPAGVRVLVDRIWPRGLRKDAARLADWCKDVAPSTQLRRWYGHDPDRYTEFAERYRAELGEPAGQDAVDRLRSLAGGRTLVLLTATKDLRLSHTRVLAEVLRDDS